MQLTRDQAITLTLQGLGNRTGDPVLVAVTPTEIQLAQQRLEIMPTLPWFLITNFTGDTQLSIAAGGQTVSVPSTFLRECTEDEGTLWVLDATTSPTQRVPLLKDDDVILREKYREATDAIPERYSLVGSTLRVYPACDIAYNFDFTCYASGAALTGGDVTNVWLQHASGLLMAELAVKLASVYMQADVLTAVWTTQRDRELKLLAINEVARREAGAKRQMGDD